MPSVKSLLVAALLLAFALPALAQTATPGLDQRIAAQERRIEDGIKSGQLTPREADQLRRELHGLRAAEAKAKADGTLTRQERDRLNRRLGQLERDIGREKRDKERVVKGQSETPGLDRRIGAQERRIERGVKSGELTPAEAAKLRRQEAKLKEAEARAKADGRVTRQERERLDRQAGRLERDITREKHDKDRVQKGKKDKRRHEDR
jgi:uncharacterized membrane protein YebE (DUF533 family)